MSASDETGWAAPGAARSSMQVSICATILRSISRCADSRLPAMASISSAGHTATKTYLLECARASGAERPVWLVPSVVNDLLL